MTAFTTEERDRMLRDVRTLRYILDRIEDHMCITLREKAVCRDVTAVNFRRIRRIADDALETLIPHASRLDCDMPHLRAAPSIFDTAPIAEDAP